MEKFYVTTAIVYANANPHIGYAYEVISADVIARYKRLKGDDVFFATGSDEHSINVYNKSLELNKDTKKYCDEMAEIYKNLWKKYNISNDDYIQTTEERHKKTVEDIFKKIYENGDIYKGYYEGLYCKSCEAFYTESDLEDGVCPIHKIKPDFVKEENYFFKLSKYQDKLLNLIEKNPEFIQPETRRNEVLNIIKSGLKDISISRPNLLWGIKLPVDEMQTVYVWFDALINYISVLNYAGDKKLFNKFWPADLHIIGKDIIKFHCIIWPAMLMAADIPVPKKIFAHGFLLKKGEKISKTKGNIVDPYALADAFGVDPIRYFLMRHITYGNDGEFSEEAIILRYNNDLANDLGNLINRTLNMVEKYCDGNIPQFFKEQINPEVLELIEIINSLYEKYEFNMEKLNFSQTLEEIWLLINKANKFIEKTAPWNLFKEKKEKKLSNVLYTLIEVIRVVSVAINPFIPETSYKIWDKIGINYIEKKLLIKDEMKFKENIKGKVKKGEPLFPRIKE